MNRIDALFTRLRGRRSALVPFIAAGDPCPEMSVELMLALVEAGADLIELGIPFSDPMADGPVIQAAYERALSQGIDVARVLELVADFRRRDPNTPVVLMGYMNPIERHGMARFLDDAEHAGADGLLIVDLPCEEAEDFNRLARGRSLAQIFLVAPTTSERRLQRICQMASGFVYYVALKGITGASNLVAEDVGPAVSRIRRHTALPVGVGFGIKGPAEASLVAGSADAVIVGSALVERIAAAPEEAVAAAGRFLGPIRESLNKAAATLKAAVQ